MTAPAKDPLLLSAKIIAVVVRIGLGIGIAGIAIGTIALGAWSLGWLPAEVSGEISLEGTPPGAIILGLIAAFIALALSFDFVSRLAAMIDTVGEGDPFTLANAQRLTRMAWLALGVQIASTIASLTGAWVERQGGTDHIELSSDLSLSGIAMVLVLFILARVFRQGARMRDELEGTV